MIEIPKDVKFIIDTLEAAGFEAFVVGGCVRDVIRGAKPKDWDIATSAEPLEAKALFSRTIDTGLKHGTITVLLNRERYEVTTYRIDGEYLDSRRPETVTFAQRIEEDLSRRDFTINAIAYSPTRGFADPFNGRGDIEAGVIKCVGNAENRFGEDALRMLRAIRFAAVLDFSVDVAALNAITKLKSNLTNISAERIREEMCKLICGANPSAAKLLETTGLLYYALRNREYGGNLDEVINQLNHVSERQKRNESLITNDANEQARLALFLAWAKDDCPNILHDLRFDNNTIKNVSMYVQFLPTEIQPDRYEIKKLMRILSPKHLKILLELQYITAPFGTASQGLILHEAQSIIEKNECFTLRDLAINGNDLLNAGIPSGKAMGETLEKLLDAVMREPSMNTRERLLCEI
ncbi:MAG: CCA tRNA nucleotidyltransferase [Defluviitaleaceae bacterium]|nr:CCA tRNA nucleotidyltransferase [Defluviitaleaceae bacterium]